MHTFLPSRIFFRSIWAYLIYCDKCISTTVKNDRFSLNDFTRSTTESHDNTEWKLNFRFKKFQKWLKFVFWISTRKSHFGDSIIVKCTDRIDWWHRNKFQLWIDKRIQEMLFNWRNDEVKIARETLNKRWKKMNINVIYKISRLILVNLNEVKCFGTKRNKTIRKNHQNKSDCEVSNL